MEFDNLRNVEHHARYGSNYLSFLLDNVAYSMKVVDDDGVYTPKVVQHASYQRCSLCKTGKHLICPALTKVKQELFEKLIEFPSIRLEWLFKTLKQK